MNCREIEELLSAFIDGEASSGERRLIARHVEGCRSCGQKLRLLSGLKASVKKIKGPPAPAALKARLRREAARRRTARPRPWRLALLGLAAGGVAAGALLLVRTRRGDEKIPIDALLAAHNEYALTMPLPPTELLYAGLADRVAQGDPHGL